MLAVIRKKFARAESVLAFSRTNPSTSTALNTLVELLAALVTRFTTVVQLRGERSNEAEVATTWHAKLRRQLRTGLLRLFSKAGLAAARTDPALEDEFRLIRPGVTGVDFLVGARSLVDATRKHADVLAKQGVAAELIDEASALIDRCQEAVTQSVEARNDRIKAVAELDGLAREAMDLIGRIDGLNQHRFADSPELLAAWVSAKSIGGPVRPRPGDGPTPVRTA